MEEKFIKPKDNNLLRAMLIVAQSIRTSPRARTATSKTKVVEKPKLLTLIKCEGKVITYVDTLMTSEKLAKYKNQHESEINDFINSDLQSTRI